MGVKRFLPLLLPLLLAGLLSQRVAFDDDEFQHAHMAWLIARGEVPHRDFFEHHLPLYHLVLAPFTLGNPGPERLPLLRGISVLLLVGAVGLGGMLLRLRTGARQPAVLAWMVCSPIFLIKMIEVRPEGFCLCLGVACACLLSTAKPRHLLAGFLAGAMVMGSQKFVFLAAGLFALCLWESRGRGALRFALGGMIAPLGVLAYLVFGGAFPEAWQQLVVMNLAWKEHFSPTMYGYRLWSHSAPLVVLAVAGLLLAGKGPGLRAALCLLAAGVAAFLLVPIPYRQTFLMLYPGLIVGAGLAWREMAKLFPDPRPARRAGVTLCLLGLLPALAGLRQESRDSLDADLALMRRVAAESRGPVFDGRGLIWFRPHVGYHAWLHHGLMEMLDAELFASRTEAAIRAAAFPDLLWDYRVDLMPESLQTFLAAHYLPVEPPPLRVPGLRVDRSRLMGAGAEIILPVAGSYRVDWQGGEVRVNGEGVAEGQILQMGTDPIRVSGRGFVRDLRFARVGGVP
jgi:hypothetical protein